MKFTISILTHSALPLARQCVESVLNNSGHEYEIILTANGNPDAAAYFNRIKFEWPDRVQVVVNDKNEGFIAPNNHALTLARGEYFITLNDDATVPVVWLDKLEAPFLADPLCAITGPRGGGCSLSFGFVGWPGPVVEYIEGSCLCIKTDLARKHGLFSDYLKFAYCEDADLSLRMRQLGHTIHQADFELASHARGATTATVPGISQLVLDNFTTCQKKWQHYLENRTFI